MSASYNLLEEPWIPCTWLEGTSTELSLPDLLLQAHKLRSLNGDSPLVIAALYRFLLAVLHAAIQGPADEDEWFGLWSCGEWKAETILTYLEPLRDRFFLFHAVHPFYQQRDARVNPKTIAAMIHDVASGNNATLFDHHTDDGGMVLTAAEAARYLIAAQTFGLAGLSGLPEKFSYAPGVGGVLFLVQGDNLFETLALNLLPYPTPDKFFPHTKQDAPAWERNSFANPNRTNPDGYLDYLTWQNRRIWLFPSETGDGLVVREMTMAPGLRQAGDISDPMKLYQRSKTGRDLPLRFSEERALWRDSSALFSLRSDEKSPPKILDWLADVEYETELPSGVQRRLMALGLANAQAKSEFYRAEQMPLRTEYLHDESLIRELDTLLQKTEAVANQVWGAANTLACYILNPNYDSKDRKTQPKREDIDPLMKAWGILQRYWAQLELTFYEMVLVTLPDERNAVRNDWYKHLQHIARDAFDGIVNSLPGESRTLKASVLARGQLEAGLAKELPTRNLP